MRRDYFFSFEMIMGNGQKFMGNAVRQYTNITSEDDVVGVETMLRQSLNAGHTGLDEYIEILTLINWKAL